MSKRDFLDLASVGKERVRALLACARALKAEPRTARRALVDKTLVMIFEAPSTRTRVSFDVAIRQLGGEALPLSAHDMQLERGETPADTGRVLSRYADALMLRTDEPRRLLEMAQAASIPVINGLTHESHPCQILADILTFEERLGAIDRRSLAYLGDGSNNIAASWLEAAGLFHLRLRFACPESHRPRADLLARARASGAEVEVFHDPLQAVDGCKAVMTDVWISMGDKDTVAPQNALLPYRVDERVMAASDEGIFMHCLPAHRGEEVTSEVLDGDRSAVWDQAENRLHAQKAVLLWCMLEQEERRAQGLAL